MQPILVYRGQFVTKPGFQILDDFGLALHGRLRGSGGMPSFGLPR